MKIELESRPKELVGYIYKFTNKTNGKIYIGKTSNLYRRLWEHQYITPTKNTAFGKAIAKYGYNNFEFNILTKIKRINNKKKLNDILNNLEKYYINKYNSYHFGYNLTKGGDGTIEFQHSKETKQKMSNTRKNAPEEVKQRLREQIIQVSKNTRFKKGEIFAKRKHIEVEQYTLNNEYIQTFYSVKDAEKSLNRNRASVNIISVCKGKYKQAYGYIWKYKTN